MSRSYSIEEAKAPGECEYNILVLGLLAAQFGTHSGKSPIRGWGKASAFRSVTVDGKVYHMTQARKKGIPGVRITEREVNTQRLLSDSWLPWSVFERPIRCYIPLESFLDIPEMEAVPA